MIVMLSKANYVLKCHSRQSFLPNRNPHFCGVALSLLGGEMLWGHIQVWHNCETWLNSVDRLTKYYYYIIVQHFWNKK